MNNPAQIEFIVPAFNESEGIVKTCERLITVLESSNLTGNIIFVDDGSTDNMWQILKDIAENDKRVKLIRFSRNFGHQAAITAGLAHSHADYNFILDADLQDPPELLTGMLALAGEGYDVVYGVRTSREGETALKKGTASLFYRVINLFSPFPIPLDAGDFRLVSARARALFLHVSDKERLNREIWAWVGLKQIGINYHRPARAFGKSKYNWKRMLKLAFDGLTAGGTGVLLVPAIVSFLLFALSIILLVSISTLAAGLAFTASAVLLGMTIAGFYIGRLYHQSRKRPTYLIWERL
ncbi:MAG: glycosyltransferase family 2 protein [Phycisphaerae bacterium]